jgi:outer membrane protein
MKKTILTSLIAALFFSYGFPQATKKLLTFEEAVKTAMQNSVLLNQQRNNLEYNQVQRNASVASLGPSVQANGQVYQVNGNSFNSQTGQLINGVRDAVTASLNANVTIFSGFYKINSIRQYSSQLEAQSYFVNRTAQDAINTVSTQYLQVMLDTELMRIAKENFGALDRQLQVVRENVKLGSRSPVDEYNQDALTKAGELRYVQSEITLNNDKSLLSQTLLIDPFEQYDVEKPNWNMDSVNADQLNMEELVKRAKQFRGDYMRAVKNEDAAKYGMRAAKGLMLPSIVAFANYGSAYNFQHAVPDSVHQYRQIIVQDPSAPSGYAIQTQESSSLFNNPDKPRPFSEQFRMNNVYKSYGVQVSIPLFNGLQNKTTYAQQRALYKNSELTRKNLEYQITNDVVRAIRNFEGSRKAYAVALDQVRAATTAFEYEKERYNLGITNFADYTNANRVYVQSQTDKAQAEFRFVFQKVILEYAVGTLKPEDL